MKRVMNNSNKGRVCVTGVTGYIGSWLVRSLLRRGYHVHATARDPGKAWQILSSLDGIERLRIFRADLNEEGSFDQALQGCVGLFHVAASMQFDIPLNHNTEDHVRTKILEPAIKGTINVLESCVKSGSIKRVIFTSSISTLTARDENGDWIELVHESCRNPIDRVWSTKPSGWVYVLSKLMTEEEAFKFARERGIDLVSIIPPTVAGPFITPNVPSSVRVLLSPITCDCRLYPILLSVHARMGSIALVHVEDICEAHIFLFESVGPTGRYLCSVGSCTLPQLANLLSSEFSSFNSDRLKKEFDRLVCSVISSKRIIDLGFRFKYDLRDIIKQSIACCIEKGFLQL